MRTGTATVFALTVAAAVGIWAGTADAVSIETLPVGDPGNAGELSGAGAGGYGPDRVCGAVDYTYNIAKYEVTAGQYCEFLNKVAKADAYGLYNPNMWSNVYGCKIERGGPAGSYNYSVAPDRANRPVNFVSWGDAARFVNWLHNGQPAGAQTPSTTEDGAYHLNGATDIAALMAVTRKANATWVIPSEDEWYKAAFYNAAASDYYVFPTQSNAAPSNDLTTPDPGNSANFRAGDDDYTLGDPYWMTEVGAFENSESPYGTFDQAGNVWEWTEEPWDDVARVARGGSFLNTWQDHLMARHRGRLAAADEHAISGFRVALVPEPATLLLLAVGGLAAMRRR